MVSFLTVGVEASTSPRDREVRMNLNIYRTLRYEGDLQDMREICEAVLPEIENIFQENLQDFRQWKDFT